MVFLTTDQKLYRYASSGWTAAVPALDITGTLTNAQIASLAASKITGQLTDGQLAGIAAAKVAGQLADAQIAGIAAAKIAGQISNGQIANGAVDAAKLGVLIGGGNLVMDSSLEQWPTPWGLYNGGPGQSGSYLSHVPGRNGGNAIQITAGSSGSQAAANTLGITCTPALVRAWENKPLRGWCAEYCQRADQHHRAIHHGQEVGLVSGVQRPQGRIQSGRNSLAGGCPARARCCLFNARHRRLRQPGGIRQLRLAETAIRAPRGNRVGAIEHGVGDIGRDCTVAPDAFQAGHGGGGIARVLIGLDQRQINGFGKDNQPGAIGRGDELRFVFHGGFLFVHLTAVADGDDIQNGKIVAEYHPIISDPKPLCIYAFERLDVVGERCRIGRKLVDLRPDFQGAGPGNPGQSLERGAGETGLLHVPTITNNNNTSTAKYNSTLYRG